jgi:hypothetical protein
MKWQVSFKSTECYITLRGLLSSFLVGLRNILSFTFPIFCLRITLQFFCGVNPISAILDFKVVSGLKIYMAKSELVHVGN